MRNLLAMLLLFIFGCVGNDTTFSPTHGDEALSPGDSAPILSQGDTIAPTDTDITSQYPDGYCESMFWVLDCKESMALIAEGPGCEKTLYILVGDEAEEVCEGDT